MIHSIVHLSNLNGKCVRIRFEYIEKTRDEKRMNTQTQQEIGENLIRDRRLN